MDSRIHENGRSKLMYAKVNNTRIHELDLSFLHVLMDIRLAADKRPTYVLWTGGHDAPVCILFHLLRIGDCCIRICGLHVRPDGGVQAPSGDAA